MTRLRSVRRRRGRSAVYVMGYDAPPDFLAWMFAVPRR
jgi:hypothetical protein